MTHHTPAAKLLPPIKSQEQIDRAEQCSHEDDRILPEGMGAIFWGLIVSPVLSLAILLILGPWLGRLLMAWTLTWWPL